MIVLMDESNQHIADGIKPMEGATRYIAYIDAKPIAVSDLRENMAVNEPHITWLEGISKREKCKMFLMGMRFLSQKPIILSVPKSEAGFFEMWVERGILRKVGFFNEIPELDEIHYFQVNRSRLWENQ